MTFRWIAVVGALTALTACGAGTGRQAGATATNGPTTSVPTSSIQPAAPTTTGPTGGAQAVSPAAATPGISDSDLAQLDQRLSDGSNSLSSADQAVTHNESGDSTP